MQCSNPIYLANNKRAYSPGIDKPLVIANCGKCLSCRQIAQNEWILRAYWHWKEYTEKLKGMVFFVTLTYSDDSIPYIVSYDTNILGEKVTITELLRGKPNQWLIDNSKFCFSCFNKKDIDRFFNSVRQHFLRKYGIDNINYLVCSEYGSQFSCRSHHHILVFIPNVWLMRPVFRDEEIISRIREIFEYYWTHVQKNGWTIYSKIEKGGALVSNPTAIKYVGKYITKDVNFWSNKDIKEFFYNVDNREQFKHCLPRHYQSKGFGKMLCDYIVDSDEPAKVLLEGYNIPNSKFQNMPYYYPIPSYIRRKLMYDVVYEQEQERRLKKKYVKPYRNQYAIINHKKGTCKVVTKVRHGRTLYNVKEYTKTLHTYVVPNSNYYEFHLATLNQRLEKIIAKLDLDLSSLGLGVYFGNLERFKSFVTARTNYKGEITFSNISEWLKSKLNGYTLLDLAIYKIVYRGVVPTTLLNPDYLGYYEQNYCELLKSKVQFPYWTENYYPSKADIKKTFQYIEPFSNFEIILDFLDKANRELSARKSAVSYDRLLQMKRTKQLFQTI